jgi:hypothetical protein
MRSLISANISDSVWDGHFNFVEISRFSADIRASMNSFDFEAVFFYFLRLVSSSFRSSFLFHDSPYQNVWIDEG